MKRGLVILLIISIFLVSGCVEESTPTGKAVAKEAKSEPKVTTSTSISTTSTFVTTTTIQTLVTKPVSEIVVSGNDVPREWVYTDIVVGKSIFFVDDTSEYDLSDMIASATRKARYMSDIDITFHNCVLNFTTIKSAEKFFKNYKNEIDNVRGWRIDEVSLSIGDETFAYKMIGSYEYSYRIIFRERNIIAFLHVWDGYMSTDELNNVARKTERKI